MAGDEATVESICGCHCDKCRHSECCLGLYCNTGMEEVKAKDGATHSYSIYNNPRNEISDRFYPR